ncbi:MAG: hypothetical protein HY719_00915 [Planctomycetes bacterium]|nr:hypothetical protein [Planctomycetota bacterium]
MHLDCPDGPKDFAPFALDALVDSTTETVRRWLADVRDEEVSITEAADYLWAAEEAKCAGLAAPDPDALRPNPLAMPAMFPIPQHPTPSAQNLAPNASLWPPRLDHQTIRGMSVTYARFRRAFPDSPEADMYKAKIEEWRGEDITMDEAADFVWQTHEAITAGLPRPDPRAPRPNPEDTMSIAAPNDSSNPLFRRSSDARIAQALFLASMRIRQRGLRHLPNPSPIAPTARWHVESITGWRHEGWTRDRFRSAIMSDWGGGLKGYPRFTADLKRGGYYFKWSRGVPDDMPMAGEVTVHATTPSGLPFHIHLVNFLETSSRNPSPIARFLFAKQQWTIADAQTWLRANGHRADEPRETGDWWAFRQPAAADVADDPNKLRRVQLGIGIEGDILLLPPLPVADDVRERHGFGWQLFAIIFPAASGWDERSADDWLARAGYPEAVRPAAGLGGDVTAWTVEPAALDYVRQVETVDLDAGERPVIGLLGNLADRAPVAKRMEQKQPRKTGSEREARPNVFSPSPHLPLSPSSGNPTLSLLWGLNPSSPALFHARNLFERFHGYSAAAVNQVRLPRRVPARVRLVAPVYSILYDSDKWRGRGGTKARYYHDIEGAPLMLCAPLQGDERPEQIITVPPTQQLIPGTMTQIAEFVGVQVDRDRRRFLDLQRSTGRRVGLLSDPCGTRLYTDQPDIFLVGGGPLRVRAEGITG